MKAYLIVFMINSFIVYEFLVRLTRKIFRTHEQNQGKIFLLLAISVLLIHALLYVHNKDSNYFQKMEVSRNFNSTELKRSYRHLQIKYHPDKIKDKTEDDERIYIELREIHEILSNEAQKDIYDKFGSKNDKLTNSNDKDEKSQANLIFALAEGALIYSVYFIFSIILTYDENVKGSRKWFILLIIFAVGFEAFCYFLKDFKEADFLDTVFPGTAIFERIELVRFSVGPLGNLIRCAYRTFFKLPFDLILDQNEKIWNYQRDLNQMLNEKNDREKLVEILKKEEKLSQEIYENIEKEIKKREEANKVGWFKKILKWGVVFLMIYGVFSRFVESPERSEL